MAEIKLTNGAITYLDDSDYERLKHIRFRLHKGSQRLNYAIAGRPINVMLHRLILWKEISETAERLGTTTAKIHVDHIDGNGLNNCRSNLRLCSCKENTRNQTRSSGNKTSKFKGVYWDKTVWRALIKVGGRKIYLGRFDNEVEAALKYNDAAKKHFGVYARINVMSE